MLSRTRRTPATGDGRPRSPGTRPSSTARGWCPPEFGPVEEDEDGITVWSLEQEGEPPPGLFVARALGRFAGAAHAAPPWASRRLLADRLAMAGERDGWPTLARTTLADVADDLWQTA